jgi:hypothetical protein
MKRTRERWDDVVELLNGIGRMLQEIDAKLDRIVRLLEEELE